MTLYQCELVNNACYSGSYERTPSGIVVHSTGANNTSLSRYVQPASGQSEGMSEGIAQLLGQNRYGNHWNQYYAGGEDGRFACVNAFIGRLANGEIATVQTLPWETAPWGVGSGEKGSYNATHVQFEICEDGLDDPEYYHAVMVEAAQLCAYLCTRYNIDVSHVVSHHEAYLAGMGGNHGDIDHWLRRFSDTMDDFRRRVTYEIKNMKEEEPMTAEEKKQFEALKDEVAKLRDQVGVRWAYIDGNMPEWMRPTVKKLADRGYLKGNNNSFEISYQLARILVILDRAGVFDKEQEGTK